MNREDDTAGDLYPDFIRIGSGPFFKKQLSELVPAKVLVELSRRSGL